MLRHLSIEQQTSKLVCPQQICQDVQHMDFRNNLFIRCQTLNLLLNCTYSLNGRLTHLLLPSCSLRVFRGFLGITVTACSSLNWKTNFLSKYKENLALNWTQISKYDGNALLCFTSHQCVCQGVCVCVCGRCLPTWIYSTGQLSDKK